MENNLLIWFRLLMVVLGACIGSFLCCQVRRLHLKGQLSIKGNRTLIKKQRTKKTNPRIHQKNTNKASKLGSRSVCLHCKTKLRWYDNLPLISWLTLRGRCRYCGKAIGRLEIVAEIFMSLAFLCISIHFSPLTATPPQAIQLVLLLIFVSILGFLALYDAAYGELPTCALVFAIIFGIILLVLVQTQTALSQGFSPSIIIQPLVSIAILGGIYLILYLVSHGRWVGDGDWLLGTSLGLALANPWLALLVLFLANLLASLYAVPQIFVAALKRQRANSRNKLPAPMAIRIPLGPFLVMAFVIVYSSADFLLSWLKIMV